MRLLLDECIPRPLLRDLTTHDAHHVVDMGWSSKRNGELLKLMLADRFDIGVVVVLALELLEEHRRWLRGIAPRHCSIRS